MRGNYSDPEDILPFRSNSVCNFKRVYPLNFTAPPLYIVIMVVRHLEIREHYNINRRSIVRNLRGLRRGSREMNPIKEIDVHGGWIIFKRRLKEFYWK